MELVKYNGQLSIRLEFDNISAYNPSNIFHARDWSKHVTWCSQNWGISDDIPQFSNFAIYVRTFSFYPEYVVKMNKTKHFEQTNNILSADRISLAFEKLWEKASQNAPL